MPCLEKQTFYFFFLLLGSKKMAKRIAEKELTDRNWDQEDEAEEVKSSFLLLLNLNSFRGSS